MPKSGKLVVETEPLNVKTEKKLHRPFEKVSMFFQPRTKLIIGILNRLFKADPCKILVKPIQSTDHARKKTSKLAVTLSKNNTLTTLDQQTFLNIRQFDHNTHHAHILDIPQQRFILPYLAKAWHGINEAIS
jgi:hypothetical protein